MLVTIAASRGHEAAWSELVFFYIIYVDSYTASSLWILNEDKFVQ